MPQEHYVLRCFSCDTFQAHIVKKTKKFECKLCGAKQSVKRNYGQGSGKDCRLQVMKLNELRMTQQEDGFGNEGVNHVLKENIEANLPMPPRHSKQADDTPTASGSSESKWEKFLDKKIEESEDSEPETDYTWEAFSNKRKKRKIQTNSITNKKIKCSVPNSSKNSSFDESSEVVNFENVNYSVLENNEKSFSEKKVNKIPSNLIKMNNEQLRAPENNSKWAKYCDYEKSSDSHSENENEITATSYNGHVFQKQETIGETESKTKTLFPFSSITDDAELDEILKL